MSDLYDSFVSASAWSAPLFALLIGAAGSLHCAGMCGGLSLAVSRGPRDPWLYNGGRLAGYLFLAFFFSLFGSFVSDPEIRHFLTMLGGAVVGLFLLAMGIQAARGRELSFRLPGLEKTYSKLFRRFARASFGRAFGIGASSILLPCALSNGFILAALSLGGFGRAAFLTAFFWAGTLPIMLAGPSLAKRLGARGGARAQRVMGVLFIAAGAATLLVKVQKAWDAGAVCFS